MKYLLAHEASRWTQSHYSQKAFEMINTQSAKNLLNQVAPEIREHWEKKNNVSLAKNIARIQEIEQNRQKPGTRDRKLEFLVIMIVISVCILLLSLLKNSVIEVKIIMIFMVASIGFCYVRLKTDRASFQKKSDEDAEQAGLSDSITAFWETILKVCEHNELPKNKIVDAEYLKDVLHVAIKDLLLKKAEYGIRRKNTSISLDDVASFASKYVDSGEYLDKQCTIVEDELGVKLDMKKMFAKASKEMKKTHPGLSDFFKTEEGEDGESEKQEG
jgi:hypothetical protein